ncbi:hypothetical protein MLD38_020081 [Melastoma candidum]|uniref:Uncharacterized protein n=1 Tax=Melastoma candidum TaxID=119954 RepID=A0ACB9QES8_9MYRT|nr:hypothetical protein MLD38_020081 [Melastoma candidum]
MTPPKLVVEVFDARDLLPKDGQGTSSPYVVMHYHGQRKRTRTVIRDLNPRWNELVEFNVKRAAAKIFGDTLELDVFHDRSYGQTRRNVFLGRIRLSPTQFVRKGEEALIYYGLEKKSLFVWVRGEIGLKIYYVDEAIPPPLPVLPVENVKQPPPETAPVESKEVPDAPQDPQQPPQLSDVEPAAATAAGVNENTPPVDAPSISDAPTKDGDDSNQKLEDVVPPAVPVSDNIQENLPPPVSPSPSRHSKAGPEIQFATEQISPPPPLPPEMRASSASASVPEVKFVEVNGYGHHPQPIPRTVAMSRTHTMDSLDSTVIERPSFDLVDKMYYLFIRVVKARHLPTNGNPVVKITVSNARIESKPARKTPATFFEWDQTFAFARDAPESSSTLEVSVWNQLNSHEDSSPDAAARGFFGGICFDVMEVPLRDPPDSPLAPQWYRLEGGGAHHGDLMLATWIGTQGDESFPDAWKTDTAGTVNARAKVYQSPKLWYLRVTVIEAQDVWPVTAPLKEGSFQVKAQLGFQVQKTRVSVTCDGAQSWNEDLLFVAAEPFGDDLLLTLENRQTRGLVVTGMASIPLTGIERRVDDRKVASRWFTFKDPSSEKTFYKGRIHLRLCFDGGYHVMDEAAHVCSDYRPTARQLWKLPIGSIELGVIGCRNLLPMKAVNGKGSTDAYCVAKYGPKWVRTRTVRDTLEPRWNEQFTWRVYDPCTVLTIGVFDNRGVCESDNADEAVRPVFRIGKVRVRISTLRANMVYRNKYPVWVLLNSGLKKMGEVELAVRFVRTTPTFDFLHVYSQPLLPLMHHLKPLGIVQQEMLRSAAAKITAAHLSRSEPPVGRREVVLYMLDGDSQAFSMRKVRANWFRIIKVITGLIDIIRWIEDTRSWKNPTATMLVHTLLVMLVWFPDLIVPTLAFYMFVIGAWNYRFRAPEPPPHFCPKMSLADSVDREELDEEFDALPSTRHPEMVRARYDKLRTLGMRVQTMLGDLAAQGERVQALVTWRDPRATGIFILLCLAVASTLYLVPTKMVAMASGIYYFRHPILRDRMPSPALNFFRRLPSLSDRLM